MILQQLYKDAGRILGENPPPPMYDTKPVRWAIQLDAAGKLLGFQPLGGDKDNKRGLPRLVPYVGRTSSVRAILLADTPAYVLGVAPEDKNVVKKHEAFCTLMTQCEAETADPAVAVVNVFLAAWSPETEAANLPPEMTPADLITFQVGDDWPVDAEGVRAFWARTARPITNASADDRPTQCLVSGLFGPTEKTLPGVIKRVPGGQASGIYLVSANENAYESYGLEATRTSPITSDAAERYNKALNQLIAGEHTHMTIGSLVYVFWTRNGPDDEFFDFLNEARPEQVQNLLAAYRSGEHKYTHLDPEPFYAFALSASGARAVIRDWLPTTVGDARERLAQWFDIHEMIAPDGSAPGHFPIKKLPYALYRDPNKEQTVQTIQALMRAAVHGDPLPRSLLDRAVMRCRAEQRVTHARAAVMKAVLVRLDDSYSPEEAKRMTQLNPANTDRAYLCGRLLAELEVVQRAALGRTNTTLVDRYFGAASTTPATVFGILLTNANKAHLPKIRKQNEGTYNALQNRIAEITAPLDGFPATLTLAQQALFSLGYYHQRAADRAAAHAAAERKRQGQATAADDVLIAATADTDTSTPED